MRDKRRGKKKKEKSVSVVVNVIIVPGRLFSYFVCVVKKHTNTQKKNTTQQTQTDIYTIIRVYNHIDTHNRRAVNEKP